MAALRLIDIFERNAIDRQRLPRVFNRHLPWQGFSDNDLRKRYRFGRESLQHISRLIANDVRPTTNRNKALLTEEQLVIALRFFGSGSFLQVIGDTHGYDKATVSRVVRKVVLALASKHADYINFPSTNEEKNAIRTGMYQIAGFPCAIGCVDGTHIRIIAPSQNEPNYVNRKGYHSINVQVICDDKGKYEHIEHV
ncbi:putative nuclease HARBI1 [Xenia sp. Carnegie-2017]|uniref:putative nuclease HARBI1 n=1 Tax=Xenia sp. Carnegie-2017 TaxID=2897299 RepID=UPI001F0359E4|nr:putative nuclease HARBI1 [Xenia sp. Carnegie-2017]